MSSTVSHRPPQRSSPAHLSGGNIVAGLSGAIAIISIMGLLGGPLSSFTMVSADARLRIAFGLLALVAFLTGLIVGVWRAPTGLVAAAVAGTAAAACLWLIRVYVLEGQAYNRLVFGWPGYLTTPIAALAGGGVARLLDDDRLHERFSFDSAARVGFWAASLWVTIEFVVRLIGATGIGPAIGSAVAGDAVAIALGMSLAALIIARYGEAHGISISDWAYRWTPVTIAVGATGAVLAVGLMWGTAQIDLALWDQPTDALAAMTEGLRAGAWIAALMLLANGLIGPICEEIAWRGVAQTAFVRAWGPWVGIAVTVVLFALKHVVIDGSLARITTLLMLGLVFGVVRHRWGTGASTVSHILVNLYSTAAVIASV